MAQEEITMSSYIRRTVFWISAPVVVFAIVGGFLSKVIAREDSYPHLRIFQEVVGLITSNYVEPVNVDKVMTGAMHGLADSLDPDSAYLTAAQVTQIESNAPMPAGDVGIDLTRQYYLHRRRSRRITGGQGGAPDRRLRPHHWRHADASDVGLRRDAAAARRSGLEDFDHGVPRQLPGSARD